MTKANMGIIGILCITWLCTVVLWKTVGMSSADAKDIIVPAISGILGAITGAAATYAIMKKGGAGEGIGGE